MRSRGIQHDNERCRGERQHGLYSQAGEFVRKSVVQPVHAIEQMQASLHLEQQAIRRNQAHARREPLCADSETLQPLTYWQGLIATD